MEGAVDWLPAVVVVVMCAVLAPVVVMVGVPVVVADVMLKLYMSSVRKPCCPSMSGCEGRVV